MAANTWKKFFILSWKNLLLKKRHWVMTILEIVIPTVLFMGIVAIRNTGGAEYNPVHRNQTTFDKKLFPVTICENVMALVKGSEGNGTPSVPNMTLYYYPSSEVTDKMAEKAQLSMRDAFLKSCKVAFPDIEIGPFSILPANSTEEIETITNGNNYLDPEGAVVYGGIIFKNMDSAKLDNIPNLDYTIRLASQYTQMYTEFLFAPFMLAGPRPANGKAYDTFAMMQTLIDLSYTELLVKDQTLLPTTPFDIMGLKYIMSSQEMPYPAYLENNLTLFLGFMMPLFLVLSFAFIVPPLLKRIVFEKETGVKELMKMMGLPSWMHWVCWFINVITVSAISIVIITLLLCLEWKDGTGPILEYSNPFLIFLMLILYASALVVSLFVISTIFSRPNLALAVGVLVHILTFVIPNTFISQTMDGYASIPIQNKVVMGLIPNINMIWAIKELMALEGKGQGLVWSSLFSRTTPDDPLSMGVCWIIFMVDIFIYSLLVWYIDNVAPGKFGVAKKFYFPFQAKYWCGAKGSVIPEPTKNEVQHNNMFEEEPNSEAGIRVKDLRKEFKTFGSKKQVLAVNGVTFSAFKGEITTLLGHNGAGKTTTMSVLTGMYSPSSGSADINGYNINEDMSKVRESLGLCPQHNMLFEDLTVREHLVFFAMLKGLSKSAAEAETLNYLNLLNLTAKTNVIVTNLSGGMKRKVNLGIALIGDSKILMLDEPTSGMDPEARRGMWDLLMSLKKDRTMLLTTHFMEEADVLGDRIAIMAKGQVKCYGTPFFLKRRFGSGYKLILTKKDDSKDEITRIEATIQSHVPSAELHSREGEEIVFYLPVDESVKFPDMFQALETAKDQLGIASFGLSLTTMEDVFLKVGEMAAEETNGHLPPADSLPSVASNGDMENTSQGSLVSDLLQGGPLIQSQMVGLLNKRMIYTWRRKMLYIVMMLIPIAMAVFTVISSNPSKSTESNHPSLDISLSSYKDPVSFVGFANSTCAECFGLKEAFVATTKGTVREADAGANLSEVILGASEGQDLSNYRDHYIIANNFQTLTHFDFGNKTIPLPTPMTELIGIFNTVPLHSRPLAQNHLSNSLLHHLEKDSDTKHSILVASHPMPQPKSWRFNLVADTGMSPTVFGFGISFPIGLSILVSSFLIFPLVERATNAKQVQIMAGVHSGTFWISNLIWDLFLYFLSASVMLIFIILLDQKEIFWTNLAWGAFMVITLLLGMFGTLFSYVFSFLADSSASGFAALIVLNILAGTIAPTGVIVLRSLGGMDETLILVSDIIRWIFNWFPIFPFTRALMAIISVQESNNLCTSGIELDTLNDICKNLIDKPFMLLAPDTKQYAQCCMPDLVGVENQVCDRNFTFNGFAIPPVPCHETKSFFTFDALNGINLDVIMLCVDGLIYFIILVMIEAKFVARLRVMIQELIPGYYQIKQVDEALDDDVEAEQRRINGNATYDNHGHGASEADLGNKATTVNVVEDVLKVSHLQKKFKRLQAVNNLSFGVKNGECFGLLGINGAGKTTTFRMLTGDEIPSKGSSSLLGISLGRSRRKYLSRIGYCPQFDSIIPQLTGKELLTLMARIRGVKRGRLDEEVARWTNFLGIQEYIERESGDYSGGNKRKLNVAMSLVGEPPVVFLDEPSTGVDPVARRNLWNIIQNIQKNGQSVVLTSHSMDECEALCDRMGIMVNGQFKCFGTVQHLKKKFAQGFTILTKLKQSGAKDLTDVSVTSATSTKPTDLTDQLEADQLKQHLQSNLDEVSVKDEHKGYIHFHVGNPYTPWHRLFRVMEEAKQKMEFLEDYTVSETTLEQVFLSFAKQQIADAKQ